MKEKVFTGFTIKSKVQSRNWRKKKSSVRSAIRTQPLTICDFTILSDLKDKRKQVAIEVHTKRNGKMCIYLNGSKVIKCGFTDLKVRD